MFEEREADDWEEGGSREVAKMTARLKRNEMRESSISTLDRRESGMKRERMSGK